MIKLCFGKLLVLGAVVTFASEGPPQYAGPIKIGLLNSPEIVEASGLAPSRRCSAILWTHNDSGGLPVLYAISATNASIRGRLRLTGVANKDWEDVTSFERQGKSWLAVADVGDNLARRAQVVLHFIPEPDPAQLDPRKELSQAPAYSIHFTYDDGPRDCESVAVDSSENAVYLLSKRDKVPQLYWIALAPTSKDHPAVARRVGTVPHLPQPHGWQKAMPIPGGVYRAEPTAMAFSSDGKFSLVLTYGDLLLFQRAAGQDWPEALEREPLKLPPHGLLQAEGACFSADGRHVYVVSEGTQYLIRYDRR